MKGITVAEYPQIIYHITYDESLTLKDLEDLINLIRTSTNNALVEMGVPRAKANSLQKIEKIEPGSIQIIMDTIQEIVGMLGDIAGIVGLANSILFFICKKMRERREKLERSPKEDKKIYEKYNVTAEIEEGSNPTAYIVHIHVCKREAVS